MSLNLQVLYFARLAQESGKSSENLCTLASTGAELFEELDARYGFGIPQTKIRLAIDECFCAWDTPLQNDTIVAFIPPVAGG